MLLVRNRCGKRFIALAIMFSLSVTSLNTVANGTPIYRSVAKLSVTKAVDTVTANADGTFTVNFEIKVNNPGSVALTHLQVVDNLAQTINPSQVSTVSSVGVTGDLSEVNTHFNGLEQTNLLGGNETLEPGGRATLRFQAIFVAGINTNPFYNLAVASARSKLTGKQVLAKAKIPIKLPFNQNSAIGVAKAVENIQLVGIDTYQMQVRLVLANLGTADVNSIQVFENLGQTFAGVEAFTILGLPSVSGGLTDINGGFNGSTDTQLLSGQQTLAAGAGAVVEFVVQVQAGGNFGPFSNQVVARGKTPQGTRVTDLSDEGDRPDADGDGNANEAGENDPTRFSFPRLRVGIAKVLVDLIEISPGRYRAEFNLRVENLSDNIDAPNIQVTDNLALSFATATNLEIVSAPVVSGDLGGANANFNGVDDLRLLAHGQTLPAQGTAQISFSVAFDTLAGTEFENSAYVLSVSDSGKLLGKDRSDDGEIVDSNGNGVANDPGEDDPTPIVIPAAPSITIGAANQLLALNQISATIHQVTYVVRVENIGAETAPNIQLQNDFSDTFATAENFNVVDVSIDGDLTALNPSFDGDSNANLLLGGEGLAPGASAQITVTVEFQPGSELGPFSNQVFASSSQVLGGVALAQDPSDDGVVVDSDGDGTANEPGENDPTIFNLDPVRIGVAKAVTAIEPVSAGGYDVSWQFVLQNLSDTQAAPNLQLRDNLQQTFGPDAEIQIIGPLLISGDLSEVNLDYDGVSDILLLSGQETLAAAGSARLTMTTRIRGVSGDFLNQALLTSAIAPGDSPIAQDLSDDGDQADANGNGVANDPGEDDPTPVTIPAVAPTNNALGLAKRVGTIVNLGDGRFSVPLIFRVENFADQAITHIQVSDNLSQTFPSPATFTLSEGASSDEFRVNPAFDGVSDTQMLLTDNILAPGAHGNIQFTVLVESNGLTQFSNLGEASGEDPQGNSVTDTSTNGDNPDPDGDGDPTNNNQPTPIQLELTSAIGLAKMATAPIPSQAGASQAGSFELRLGFVVENLGDSTLTQLQVTDDLTDVFAGFASFQILGNVETQGGLVPNPNYDGDSDINLLIAQQSTLAVGARAEISFSLQVTPTSNVTSFENIAFVRATDPQGDEVTDQSTDGIDPDPNQDGDPEEAIPTPIELPAEPIAGVIGVAKQVIGTQVVSADEIIVTFRLVAENLGSVDLRNVRIIEDLAAAFPSPAETSVVLPVIVSGSLSQSNANFDGVADTQLLSGTESLGAGETASIEFAVAVVLNGAMGPFANQVVVSAEDPEGNMTSDPSDDGSNPDPNDDGDPGSPGEDDPTPVPLPSGLVGSVFEDLNLDAVLDDGDLRLPAWRVEVLNEQGMVVATTFTDSSGNYQVLELPAATNTVQFRHPDNNVVWGERVVELLDNTIVRADFPVVPGGRVYASIARDLVPGVTLALLDNLGTVLPAACLLFGQQNQTVGEDAAYRFDVQTGAASACPNTTSNYRIQIVDTPSSFRATPSVVLPTQSSPLAVSACVNPSDLLDACLVQPQTGQPQGNADTTYYLQWSVGAGDGSVANNHIPLDLIAQGADLMLLNITKNVTKTSAVIGDLVGYELLVTNLTASAISGIDLLDNLPPGFQFVEGSQSLRLPGGDGVLDTLDDVITSIDAQGIDPVIIGPFTVPPMTTVAVRYLARVSTGVTQGEYVNTVSPLLGGTVIGNTASASVDVVSDPIFERTTVIGKVFNDVNGNGAQDDGEAGLAGVRLASVGGLLIETDRHGRYHIADVEVSRAERGANFILKLDTATLPDGAQVVSENPRVIRLTQALMSKINFAVQLPGREGVSLEELAQVKVIRTVTRHLAQRIEPVRFESGQSDVPASYLTKLRALLAQYQDRANLRLRFVGHTDNEPLSVRAQARYVDNQGLSEARAQEVAKIVAQQLQLAPSMIESAGMADRQAIASNSSRTGMALNRRVEIEVVFDEEVIESQVHNLTDVSGQDEIKTIYEASTISLEPVRFESAVVVMSQDVRRGLARTLTSFSSKKIDRIEVVGHADTTPYSDATGNHTLAQQRAQSVAHFLAETLSVADQDIVVTAMGASQPIADNNSEYGRLLNRRVEIKLTYQRDAGTIATRYEPIAPIQMSETQKVAGGGQLWMTEDALALNPQLEVLALSELAVDSTGHMVDPLDFAAFSNYGEFVNTYQLDIYRAEDTDLVRPLVSLTTDSLSYPHAFEYLNDELVLHPGQQLAYVLRALGVHGQQDTTHARLVKVVADNKTNLVRGEAESVWGQSNLNKQGIVMQGSRIRIHGDDFVAGEHVQVGDMTVPVDANGRFAVEYHAPKGVHNIVVSGARQGRGWQQTLTPTVDDNYSFVVALANLTFGQHDLSGDFEPLSVDDHFDESVFVDGRLAFYAKAKIKGKYLITAQMDSTEDELRNFGDNLRREDPRRLFRQLDPDRYYAVYGDDSTTVSDVDTQGAFYLRVDWNRNQVLWGNFNTGMTDTEYLQYNRSLYGAKLTHKSNQTTRYGDAKRAVTLFASKAQSAAAHVSFQATGGSLYYLRHTDVVQGSEKVWVEVRQRDTQQVVERQDFIEGRDYEIDAIQGRIILRAPLSQVVNSLVPAIIRSTPLDGDQVHLLVDYEYIPVGFDAEDATFGGRAHAWVGDHIGVGISKVIDERAGTDFDLQGIDVTLKAGRGTYLRAEIAQSEARQSEANFASADGGLSFLSQNSTLPGTLQRGDALAIEGRVNLQELNENLRGDVRGWWKERDAEFSAGRLPQGTKVTEQGVDFFYQASDNLKLSGGYAELEEETISHSRIARIQADLRLGKITLGGEVRYEDLERQGTTPATTRAGDGLLAGVRLGFDLNDSQTLYAAVQTGVSETGNYQDNDLYAVGLNTQLSEHTAVSIEASDGDRGHALTGGFEYSPADNLNLNMKGGVGPGAISQFSGNYRLAEGHELYGSYSVDPDRTFGERNLLTVGQRRDFGNKFGIFTESQFGKDDAYAGVSHAFGLDYTTEQDWVLTSLLQASDNETSFNEHERTAISIGASVKRDDYKFSAKMEYRQDESPIFESEQYLLSSSYTRIINEAQRWLGQLNISWTNDELNGGRDARFVEFDIGHAYRPTDNDRWNVLTKYGYFYDLVSTGQSASRPDQRVHILSTQALYQISKRWELGGKIALKEGQVRMFRDSGSWQDYGVGLAVIRARYHVTKAWDGVAEYRLLRDRHGENDRQGVLLGVYRHMGDHFKVGVGYNFTDFSDDIRDAQYDNQGWFVDLVGKF